MNVGLPGTGIGGIFYMITVGLIFVYEFFYSIFKKSTKARWKVVLEEFLLTVTMILIAILINELMGRYIFHQRPPHFAVSKNPAINGLHLVQVHPILVPFLLLFCVLVSVNIISVVLKLSKKSRLSN